MVSMANNLLKDTWADLDSAELRLLLDERIGQLGQYDDRAQNPNVLCLPLAGASCRIKITFRDKKIERIEPGQAFDAAEWGRVSQEIEGSILAGPIKVGRDFSFSSFRVEGSWRGGRSGLQILAPPEGTPCAPVEDAEHPFVLEFPLRASDLWQITNHRRIREHRRLTLLLNVLLAGRTSLQPRRFEHFWASVPTDNGGQAIKWVQQFFIANFGEVVQEKLSAPAPQPLEALDPEVYYVSVGHDGRGLCVPTDLDQSVSRYLELLPANREKFDRAAFWMDMASRLWTISMSASFAALVSAIESLTERGQVHRFSCPVCAGPCQHEVPSVTERFRAFFEEYAGGAPLRGRRSEMYSLRSGILHGSELMQLDQDLAFGWDPPYWNERELHEELWELTRVALRNWLKNPTSTR
jgi:hypothetical protein